MPRSGFTVWSVVADEQPTTAKWNIIGSNMDSLSNGNGIDDNTIISRHILAGNVTNVKLGLGANTNKITSAGFSTSSASYVDVTGASLTITTPAGVVLIMGAVSLQAQTGGTFDMFARVVMDGSPSTLGAGTKFTSIGIYNGANCALFDLFTGVTAASHTFKLQIKSNGSAMTDNGTPSGTVLNVIPLTN